MNGTLTILGCFLVGIVLGWSTWLPENLAIDEASLGALYVLMLLVGISIGADGRLREMLRTLHPRVLLVPVCTVIGTFVGVAAVSIFLPYSLAECLAVGAGFGYYSFSSIFITQYRGVELGTIALMSNIIREVITLLGAVWLARCYGALAPICAGGSTTMDTTLPVIIRASGKDMLFTAIVHALVLDLTIPFWLLLFCSFA